MWHFMPPLPHTGVTPGLHHFLFEHLQNLELCVSLLEPFPAPNFKETLIVAIKQGGRAKAAISTVLEKIDSMIKHSPFLAAKVAFKGEIVKEINMLITTS
jgi:hypothetical protein